MKILKRYSFIWNFRKEKEKAYLDFTLPINFISLRMINVLIIIGMTSFIFVDLFRHVNYPVVLVARLALASIALLVIIYSWNKKISAGSVEVLMTFSLVALVMFAFLTAMFGHMPSFFLTNISVTILVFVSTISGLRLRHTLLFNGLYLTLFIFYTQVLQRDPFYFSQYSNLFSMFIYSTLAGVLIEIRRRNNFLQYKDLLLQKQKVEELNQQKNKIISLLSHDIASPINSLSGLLQLPSSAQPSTSEIKLLLKEIGNRLHSVSTLIHNLVRWSRSQMSGFSVEKKNTELVSLLNEIVNLFQPNASEKSQELKLSSADKVIINADEEMIRIALRNLISNAIKFGNKNSTINIDLIEDGQDQVIIKVTNSGPSISKETLKKLFGYDVSSALGTNGEKGTGLGLAMAAHFINLNGGQIILENTEQNKTTFSIRLPKS